jgi:Domain of unknown function (DUF1905)
MAKTATFTATVLGGHKGLAFEVPFDPGERWDMARVGLRPGRRGYPVHGRVGRIGFDSFAVARSKRFWVLVAASLAKDAKLRPGDAVRVSLGPGHGADGPAGK